MPTKREKLQRSPNYGFYADLIWCCMPLMVMSCYSYGLRPALLSLVAVLVAYLCDCILAPLHGPGYQPHEPSSECFALLIVMMMPATVRYYVVVVAVVAAVIAKEAFGGEGHYPFHPAAVGLAVAGVAWPEEVFRYPTPGTALPLWDASSVALTDGMNATLAGGGLPTASTLNLVTGNVAGPLGTSAALVIVACGLFLLCRGRLHLSTVLPYAIVYIGLAWLLPNLNELPVLSFPWQYVRQRIYLEKYIILSGAMLFGGVFLACEPVTQPNRTGSRIVYGAALGALSLIFRYYSNYEVGVCFALLMVNAIPEWLDRAGRRTEKMKLLEKEVARHGEERPEAE